MRIVEQIKDFICFYPQNKYVISSRIVGYNDARMGNEFSHIILQPFTDREIKLFAEKWYLSIRKRQSAIY